MERKPGESMADFARRFDAEAAMAGGMAAWWAADQRAKRERGDPHYTVLRESTRAGRVIARIDDPA